MNDKFKNYHIFYEIMKDLILKWALKNAVDHDGKAQLGAVIPKIIGEKPSLKDKVKEIAKEASAVLKEVNKMTIAEQTSKLEKIAPELLEKKEHKQGLPPLPDAIPGKVVMIFPPEPSKYTTIGHAKACILNYYYAKENKGKFIIRFEDTNWEKVKNEYYDQFLKDFEWLGIKWDKVDYVSDHVDDFYKSAEKLIKNDDAYMCNCPAETIHSHRFKKQSCACRKRSVKQNLELWEKMLDNKFKEGEYSLRAKIGMEHKNAAMRDPTIMRVLIGTHPRVGDKYSVWPVYDFATAIMDKIEGVTHRIRGKEFEVRAELQQWIQEKLGIKSPVVLEYARINFEGVPSSGRLIREGIATEKYLGWDDPRLSTIVALKKRGFLPEAIWKFSINTGMSKTESTLEWSIIEAENRKLIDPLAKRYFFVPNPIKLKVEKAPQLKAKLNYHPDKDFGSREIDTNDTFFIPGADAENMEKGELFRLKDLYNVKIIKKMKSELICEYAGKELVDNTKKIQWVTEDNVGIEIMVPNFKNVTLDFVKGIAEKSAVTIKIGEVIQFERFGFARLDSKDKTLKFVFAHK